MKSYEMKTGFTDVTLESKPAKKINAVISDNYDDYPDFINGKAIYANQTDAGQPFKEIGRVYNAQVEGKKLTADIYLFDGKFDQSILTNGFVSQLIYADKNPYYLVLEPSGSAWSDYSKQDDYKRLADGITPMPNPGPITPTQDQGSPYGPDGQILPIGESPAENTPYDGMFGIFKPMWEGDQ